VTTVWHIAAVYDLAVGELFAYRVNVVGTSKVLDFCEACANFERLNYVSTCYVAGERHGLVREDELDEGQGHKNHYESTKFWAELEVQRRRERIPTVIFRPLVVVGDSQTGEIPKYDGPYMLMRFISRLPQWVPPVFIGEGEAHFNIAPVDYVVGAMLAIAAKPDTDVVGEVFQLADPNPMRARDFLALVIRSMGRPEPKIALPKQVFDAILAVPQLRKLTGIPREGAVYFNHAVRFDVSNTLEALQDTDIRCPHPSTYMRTLLDYMYRNPEM
ncbi:MAG: SDR family oxidoreductase, partial [Myxococcales bacterium]|nr:SDR family oxidoreductase [Myxococcales bacterium]